MRRQRSLCGSIYPQQKPNVGTLDCLPIATKLACPRFDDLQIYSLEFGTSKQVPSCAASLHYDTGAYRDFLETCFLTRAVSIHSGSYPQDLK